MSGLPPAASTDPDRGREQPHEPPEDVIVIRAEALFRGRRQVTIEHDGVRYRLRITRKNKLILQK